MAPFFYLQSKQHYLSLPPLLLLHFFLGPLPSAPSFTFRDPVITSCYFKVSSLTILIVPVPLISLFSVKEQIYRFWGSGHGHPQGGHDSAQHSLPRKEIASKSWVLPAWLTRPSKHFSSLCQFFYIICQFLYASGQHPWVGYLPASPSLVCNPSTDLYWVAYKFCDPGTKGKSIREQKSKSMWLRRSKYILNVLWHLNLLINIYLPFPNSLTLQNLNWQYYLYVKERTKRV